MTCSNNLKQLALACHNYVDVFSTAPLSYGQVSGAPSLWIEPVNPTARQSSWIMQCLPFIEQRPLYDQIDRNYDLTLDPRNFVNGGTILAPADPSNAWVRATSHLDPRLPKRRCYIQKTHAESGEPDFRWDLLGDYQLQGSGRSQLGLGEFPGHTAVPIRQYSVWPDWRRTR